MNGDLEIFLRNYAGLVLINLWEQDCPASRAMEQLMRELERSATLPILRLTLTDYHDWARRHGVYGTPALVAYYQGRPLFRLIGRTTLSELLQRLHDHGQ
jgi:hypothetical protein